MTTTGSGSATPVRSDGEARAPDGPVLVAPAVPLPPADPDATPERPGLPGRAKAGLRRLLARPGIAHLMRSNKRFGERQGSQFAAAITYFSFLSLVPIIMVAFAVTGFVLAGHQNLINDLKGDVTSAVPGSLSDKIGSLIDNAVSNRLAVGIVGLVGALYAGIGWMGNIRAAVRAQWRPRPDLQKSAQGSFVTALLRNLGTLVGLGLAVVISLALTVAGTAAASVITRALGLQHAEWFHPVLSVATILVAVLADLLIFLWLYSTLPEAGDRPPRRALVIGSLAMAVVFEILKSLLSVLVARFSSSPTGAIFGPIIGLLAFFNLVAGIFLRVAAWIATAHMPTAAVRVPAITSMADGWPLAVSRPRRPVATYYPSYRPQLARALGVGAIGGWWAARHTGTGGSAQRGGRKP